MEPIINKIDEETKRRCILIEQARELYLKGYTTIQVMAELGLTESQVRNLEVDLNEVERMLKETKV